MSENIKISKEIAEEHFAKLEEYYGLGEFENEDQEEFYNTAKAKVVKAIKDQKISINIIDDDFKVIQTTKNGSRIEYREIDGRSKMEMSKAKDEHARMYALLGSLSGVGLDAIMQLKGQDLSIAEHLGAVFLAV